MMVERDKQPFRISRYEHPVSTFKVLILQSLMSRAKLFDLPDKQKPEKTMEVLDELVGYYAAGSVGKIRPTSDNTVEFRVNPINGKGSYTFDGLSSGQKEIISTLFLIWYHTRNNSMVVLIDEPELHLNPQWHQNFVKRLIHMAPNNQYIMATHSEDIMDSVDRDRRILLLNEGKNGK